MRWGGGVVAWRAGSGWEESGMGWWGILQGYFLVGFDVDEIALQNGP